MFSYFVAQIPTNTYATNTMTTVEYIEADSGNYLVSNKKHIFCETMWGGVATNQSTPGRLHMKWNYWYKTSLRWKYLFISQSNYYPIKDLDWFGQFNIP